MYRLSTLNKYRALLFLAVFVRGFVAFSQTTEQLTPEELFSMTNYVQAIPGYLNLEKEFPEDKEIKYRLGVCYLYVHADKKKALDYFIYCYSWGMRSNELHLNIARTYHYLNQFDSAIVYYNKYRDKVSAKKQTQADLYINSCETAKEMIKKKVNVTFENLGPLINSKYADYYPFVTKDQSTLYFTSRREESIGNLRSFYGYHTSDVYSSKVRDGKWTRAADMGKAINSEEDEECVGISHDGKTLILFEESNEIAGDLYFTNKTDSGFTHPIAFASPINTPTLELEGCYGSDTTTFYFTSSREDGLGESDIYFAKRLPNGKWGQPQNIKELNTPYKEAFPQISDDGKTMYFSSEGHVGMGGFDIFKSTWDQEKEKWNAPVNMGYPINTTDDDMMFSLAENNRDGYISAYHEDGYGDYDIYKIIFNDVDQQFTALKGAVHSIDSASGKKNFLQVALTEVKTNRLIEDKKINPNTGKYIFVVPPGSYKIKIYGDKFTTIEEEVIIRDKSEFVPEIEKNFIIKPAVEVIKPETPKQEAKGKDKPKKK